MDDLAEELGMSKKTLYAHFASKRVLIEAVIEQKISQVAADLERASAEAGEDFPAQLSGLLICMREHTGEIGEAYLRDIRREEPELFALVQKRRRELIQRFIGKLLQDGRRAGQIRRDIPVTFMIEVLMAAVDGVVNPARMEELEMTPKTAFYQIITMFLEGVIVKEGKEKR